MKAITIFILSSFLFFACTDKTPKYSNEQVKLFDQFIGTWKIIDKNTFEIWAKNEEGMYTTDSYKIIKEDTVHLEHVDLITSNGNLFFKVKLMRGEDDFPVKFKQIKLEGNYVEFQNKTNDFPKQIRYELIDDQHLNASIHGLNNGEKISVDFNYVKAN